VRLTSDEVVGEGRSPALRACEMTTSRRAILAGAGLAEEAGHGRQRVLVGVRVAAVADGAARGRRHVGTEAAFGVGDGGQNRPGQVAARIGCHLLHERQLVGRDHRQRGLSGRTAAHRSAASRRAR
jgi:hypothetical protein